MIAVKANISMSIVQSAGSCGGVSLKLKHLLTLLIKEHHSTCNATRKLFCSEKNQQNFHFIFPIVVAYRAEKNIQKKNSGISFLDFEFLL